MVAMRHKNIQKGTCLLTKHIKTLLGRVDSRIFHLVIFGLI
jgi:hypothetical protein